VDSIKSSFEQLSRTVDKTLEKITKTMDAKDRREGSKEKKGSANSIMGRIIGDFDFKAPERGMLTASANIQKFVDKTIKDINRLKDAQQSLESSMPAGANNAASGQGWSYNAAQKIGLPLDHPQNPPGGSFTEFARNNTDWAKMRRQYQDFKEGGGWEGYLGGRGETLGRTLGLGAPGSAVLGAVGRGLGAMGPWGAALGAGAYVANKSFESFDELRPNQVNYTLDKPFMQLKAAGSVAGVHQRLFSSVQGGDLAYLGAYRSALADEGVRKSLNNTVLNKESLLAVSGMMKTSLTGKGKNLWDKALAMGSASVGYLMEVLDGNTLEETEGLRAKEIIYHRAAFGLVDKQADSFQQAVGEHYKFGGGYHNMMANRIKNDAFGRVRQMNMSGRSTQPGKDGALPYEAFRAQLMEGGWDISDHNQGYQALLGVGKGYGKVLSPTWGVVGGHMAGLGNIESIVAAAGTAGGNVARAGQLKDILQGSTGRGGLDVAVANKLFSDTLNSINSTGQWGIGNTANGYASLAAGLVSGGYDSKGALMYDVGGQQRRMAALAGGNKALQSFTSGTAAPIFNTMSLYAGIEATGGKWGIGSEAVRDMDPRELASIVKGGDVSDYYRFTLGDGSTPEGKEKIRNMAQTVLSKGVKNVFGGVVSDAITDKDGRKFIDDVKYAYAHGGTFSDVLEDRTWQITDKRAKAEAQASLRRGAAGLLQTFYKNGTNQDYEMMLEGGEEYSKREWGTQLHGQGVGVSKPKGVEGIALKAESEKLKTESLLGGIGKVEENTAKIVTLLQVQNAALLKADLGSRIANKKIPKDAPEPKEATPQELVDDHTGQAWGKGNAKVAVPLNAPLSGAEGLQGIEQY
jgi:hypothetical protein